MEEAQQSQSQMYLHGDDDAETDGSTKKTHYRGNIKKAGYVVYTVSSYSYRHVLLTQAMPAIVLSFIFNMIPT